jgi:acetone carboxylase gamma subunit
MDTIIISGRIYTEESIVREREEYVRLEAVDYFFALSKLIYDKSALVRTAVARKLVGHDILAKDRNWRVRATVAKYTEDIKLLEILANDDNDFVRFVVVKKGFHPEYFINDEDEEISSIARYQIQMIKAA